VADRPSYFEAYDAALTPLLGAQGFLALVQGAEAIGLLEVLREPATDEQLAAATGLSDRRVRAVRAALLLHDVVEPAGAGHRLTGAWAALVADDAFVALADSLASAQIEARLLRDVAAGPDYWTMPAADRILFARAVSANPFSPGLVEAFRRGLEHDPAGPALAAGGPLLELGCGVAGRVLTLLQAVPGLRAVGVELSDDLAAEARRRAQALGVGDRFEVVCADADAFSRPESFAVAFWSQFFFPDEARTGALRTMFTSLRSGGLAQAPLLGDDAALRTDEPGAEARERAIFRVILDGWGVPDRDRDGLAAEFEEAGFVDAHYVGGGAAGPLRLVARKP
jgi:SAM-dependent methyltransferase